MRISQGLATLPLLAATLLAHADEGMWPLWPAQQLPQQRMEASLGLKLDAAWLAHQQAAAVNVGGASGSFVSAEGLVLTNHHVVRTCIDRLSSREDNLAEKGFVAARRSEERRCPGLVLKVLQRVSDVSARVPAEAQARKTAISALEAPCTSEGRRCQVVALWGGARHHLYEFLEYRDARLVMAPEAQAANFGGDDDNFHYPRFAFDLALLRAYGPDGQPVRPAAWLKPATQALGRHEPVFSIGHPGRTERLLSIAQLSSLRDVVLPADEAVYADEQAVLRRFGAVSAETARQAAAPLASVENRLKALRGEAPALHDAAVIRGKRELESRIRAQGEDALWQQAAAAASVQTRLYPTLAAQRPLPRSLLAHALNLAALHDEAQRPTAEQLEDYRGAKRDALLIALRANEPFYAELETVRLAAFIRRAQQQLGGSDAFVRALLGGQATAEAAAARWVQATRLRSAEQRARWLDAAAWKQLAEEPLMQLAQQLHSLRRPVLASYEAEVTQALRALAGPMAQARWRLLGDAEAPDATGTLRLSYGRTEEVLQGGLRQPWKSTLAGLYARADAFDQQDPYQLSHRLAARRTALLQRFASTPLNFISNNDIIGGNSGSPLVNARGELVGLAFDGNAESLPGRFHYDGRGNRAVSVHLDAIFLALEQVYDAAHLAREIKGQP